MYVMACWKEKCRNRLLSRSVGVKTRCNPIPKVQQPPYSYHLLNKVKPYPPYVPTAPARLLPACIPTISQPPFFLATVFTSLEHSDTISSTTFPSDLRPRPHTSFLISWLPFSLSHSTRFVSLLARMQLSRDNDAPTVFALSSSLASPHLITWCLNQGALAVFLLAHQQRYLFRFQALLSIHDLRYLAATNSSRHTHTLPCVTLP